MVFLVSCGRLRTPTTCKQAAPDTGEPPDTADREARPTPRSATPPSPPRLPESRSRAQDQHGEGGVTEAGSEEGLRSAARPLAGSPHTAHRSPLSLRRRTRAAPAASARPVSRRRAARARLSRTRVLGARSQLTRLPSASSLPQQARARPAARPRARCCSAPRRRRR